MSAATGYWIKLLIYIVIFIIYCVGNGKNYCKGFEVYFPMTAIQLNLPINEKSQSIFSKIPIGQFQVLPASNNSQISDYKYSIESNKLLEINATSGEVFMRNDYEPLEESRKYTVTAKNDKKNESLGIKHAHMSLQLNPLTDEDYCKNLENICFWSSVRYTVLEDDATIKDKQMVDFWPIQIGSLNPRGAKYLCPYIDLKYQLLNGTDLFMLKNNMIFTRHSLDYEILDALQQTNFSVAVNCLIKVSLNQTETFRKVLNIQIIDRNDNGPELQNVSFINFQMDSAYFNANDNIGERIIFVDRDSIATNVHQTYRVINDTNDLIRPICNVYENESLRKRSTIISCQITFSRNGIATQPNYCFALEASDKTIDSPVKNQAIAQICLKTDPELILAANHPEALPLKSRQNRKLNVINTDETFLNSDIYSRTLTRSIPNSYPKHVYVYRTAQQMYRVTQPEDFRNLIKLPQLQFTLADDRSQAFGITPAAGIVYVKDIAALKAAPETIYFLNVTWHDTYHRFFVVNVHLVEGRPDNSSCEHKVKSRSQTCAQIKYRKQCQQFCGLATNGGACVWRGTNNARFSTNYASCVPNATFCPDNICDPLEELNNFACPQDCTGGNKILSPLSVSDKLKGISSASGTCTCEDNGKCSCAPLDDDEPRPKRKKNKGEAKAEQNVLKSEQQPGTEAGLTPQAAGRGAKETDSDEDDDENESLELAGVVCNKTCVIIAIACPTTLLLIILFAFIARASFKKGSRGKIPEEGNTCSKKEALAANETHCANGDLPLAQLENSYTFQSSLIDSKWEIPRESLTLDSVLGEGEFGKVMKGYLNDIEQLPGETTVAVKMLKRGANSVEYMALLSEFQLLQEVSHPNVIRLLGACTKGDAPMIIIEYARFGALRSYLRLCRKIEYSGAEYTDGIEPMTVRSILSFAWQICKGMTYLTEIKLVHRDLAARNVLLADGKICKISDFGLTRDVYEDDAYLKRSRERVPVKWMAPESLADNVYTSKSDVWSFGVLCWELITLGASPYPGVPVQNLYNLLKGGFRMEKPENCSDEIYSIVKSCWMDDPNARPSFKYLISEFERLLGPHVKDLEMETKAFSNPLYCLEEDFINTENLQEKDIAGIEEKLIETEERNNKELPELYTLDHLWKPPKICYDIQECSSRDTFSFSSGFLPPPPPGYDMPRPLNETRISDPTTRYENDLRYATTLRKSSLGTPSLPRDVYSVPVKRGRSYMDMTTRANMAAEHCGKIELTKTISFKFSSNNDLDDESEESTA